MNTRNTPAKQNLPVRRQRRELVSLTSLQLLQSVRLDRLLHGRAEANLACRAEDHGRESRRVQVLHALDQLHLECEHHLLRQLRKPQLDGVADRDSVHEIDRLPFQTLQRLDLLLVVGKVHGVNRLEQLFEVGLDDGRILRLPENLQQVVVPDEVEPREFRPLLLQEVAQRLLAAVQLPDLELEALLEVHHVRQRLDAWVRLHLRHQPSEVLVHLEEAALLVRKRPPAEDGLQVQPLALNRLQVAQGAAEQGQYSVPLLRLAGELGEVGGVPDGLQHGLEVAHLGLDLPPLLDEHNAPIAAVKLLDYVEDGLHAPLVHLVDRVLDRHFRSRPRLQLLYVRNPLHNEVARIKEVVKLQVAAVDPLRKIKHLEQAAPVVLRERIPLDKLEVGHILFQPLDLRVHVPDHSVDVPALQPLGPLRQEILHDIEPLPNGHPVLLSERRHLAQELLKEAPGRQRLGDVVVEGV